MSESIKHGYWLHLRRKSDTSTNGYFFVPECICSVCGKHSSMEKDKCPYCGALMDMEAPEDAAGPFIEEKTEKKEEPVVEHVEDHDLQDPDEEPDITKGEDLTEDNVDFLKSLLKSYQDTEKSDI